MIDAQDDGSSDFDTQAAVTRSMLGWGVLAGPLYLVTGLLLAVTRDGFNLGEHALSLLMLGDDGWIQRTNLFVSALACAVAATGFHRAMNRPETPSRGAPLLVAGFALGLVGSGTFAPDPMGGFPPGAESEPTISGLLHLGFGAFQFACLAVACLVTGRWMARQGEDGWRRYSTGSGIVILIGFLGGAALASFPIGVGLLWLAVVACYAWLAATSIYLWRSVPHPDADRRQPTHQELRPTRTRSS